MKEISIIYYSAIYYIMPDVPFPQWAYTLILIFKFINAIEIIYNTSAIIKLLRWLQVQRAEWAFTFH